MTLLCLITLLLVIGVILTILYFAVIDAKNLFIMKKALKDINTIESICDRKIYKK